MRHLRQQERAAMWLYRERYAAQAQGAIEFYRALSNSEKATVQRMLHELWPRKKGIK